MPWRSCYLLQKGLKNHLQPLCKPGRLDHACLHDMHAAHQSYSKDSYSDAILRDINIIDQTLVRRHVGVSSLSIDCLKFGP